MRSTLLTALAVVILGGMPARAEEPANRFRLEKTDGGFIRLDQQTGAITFCREQNGSLSCRMAADERAAYERELDMLTKRVEALEASSGKETLRQPMPSDAEVERSLSIMERFMRSFMGLVREFRSEEQTSPNRT